MGHEAEITRRILVAEGRDARCEFHHTGNHLQRLVGEGSAEMMLRLRRNHLVLAVFRQAHVNVQTAASLARRDFRCEGHVQTLEPRQIANHPLGNHQLVGGVAHGHGQELNLVLLVAKAVLHEVSNLGMAVFDLSAGLCDVVHTARAEIVGLGVGAALVIAALVSGGINVLDGLNHVVFQLAHRLIFHSCHLAESLCSAA